MKHTLSLWETIAVELARQLCLRGQEPFDSIGKDFLRDLSEDEDGEDQFKALDCCLDQFDPDLLLGTLYEFIETYVKHSPQQERDQPYVYIFMYDIMFQLHLNYADLWLLLNWFLISMKWSFPNWLSFLPA